MFFYMLNDSYTLIKQTSNLKDKKKEEIKSAFSHGYSFNQMNLEESESNQDNIK